VADLAKKEECLAGFLVWHFSSRGRHELSVSPVNVVVTC
jgi:hypothetical protein